MKQSLQQLESTKEQSVTVILLEQSKEITIKTRNTLNRSQTILAVTELNGMTWERTLERTRQFCKLVNDLAGRMMVLSGDCYVMHFKPSYEFQA